MDTGRRVHTPAGTRPAVAAWRGPMTCGEIHTPLHRSDDAAAGATRIPSWHQL